MPTCMVSKLKAIELIYPVVHGSIYVMRYSWPQDGHIDTHMHEQKKL